MFALAPFFLNVHDVQSVKCKSYPQLEMSEHRFHLRKYFTGCKVRCPDCGHKSFNLYIDSLGEVVFPEDVGWCDRPSCHSQHDHSPTRYFQEHPEKRPKDYCDNRLYPIHSLPLKKIEPKPIMFMPTELMEQTLKGYESNQLFTFLCSKAGEEKVSHAFTLYKIGTARLWNSSTIFWQIDIDGRIRTGKIIKYGPDGHRVKSAKGSLINWTHSLWRDKPTDFQITQCFFGEHLLQSNLESTIMVVESEKSALIGYMFFPEFLWLASGGNNGCLNPQASKVLSGRKVILVPDLNMEKDWNVKAAMLAEVGADVSLFDMEQFNPTPQDRDRGLDIADFILSATPSSREAMFREFEEIKRYWRENNPELYENFMKFYTDFDCELVSIRPMTEEEIARYGKPRTSDGADTHI